MEISWFVYVVRLREGFPPEARDQVLENLRSQGIACNNYFSPIHLQPYFRKDFGYKEGDFPVTENVSRRTLALPFFNRLSEQEARAVVDALKTALVQLR